MLENLICLLGTFQNLRRTPAQTVTSPEPWLWQGRADEFNEETQQVRVDVVGGLFRFRYAACTLTGWCFAAGKPPK